MLKMESLLVFAAIAEAGSISAAARRLQISKSAASERLAELENNIGVTLVRRSTRKLALTDDGLDFLEHARRILGAVDDATAGLSERRGELAGPLRIAAPISFGVLHLGPALNQFAKLHPRIELSLELDDRAVGAADGFDAVIRHGPVPDNGLIVKRFAASRRRLVAAPAYLKTYGVPRTLEELGRHRGIIYTYRGGSDWRFRQGGRWLVARPESAVRFNNGILMRGAVEEGLGIALLPRFLYYDLLKARKVRVIDVGVEAEPGTVFIAYPSDRRVTAKILALTAHLRASFGNPPYWER
ncbi:MAG: LysR family transcriptional regulator [Alphaproteobacteria bacterium]|jgi:DNA-binding transcriptional LysR family regulator|nr:LysR family transcriptional regulator [Alphaproteobacteria bacterium]